ncbi:MAG: metallopeptidase family protein [Chloroflexi bacterium]|nr:metallopeptidase family protein [Chloroflexota bacterium]
MPLRRRWSRLTPERKERLEFERLVREAVISLPIEFRSQMQNVDIVVEDEPSPETIAEAGLPPGHTLYGYYQGVPRHHRGSWYTLTLPDKITIFRNPITMDCRTRREVRRLVRSTVIHEIAHHFGIGDDALKRLGLG